MSNDFFWNKNYFVNITLWDNVKDNIWLYIEENTRHNKNTYAFIIITQVVFSGMCLQVRVLGKGVTGIKQWHEDSSRLFCYDDRPYNTVKAGCVSLPSSTNNLYIVVIQSNSKEEWINYKTRESTFVQSAGKLSY